MKGKKPNLQNVVPMKGDIQKHVPEAPEFLEDEARKVWDELAPELVKKDRLEPLYEYQFASYCVCVANFIAASACLAVEGLYYETKTRNGIQQKKRAAWGIQQEAMAGMRRDAALFGLSPVDEARLGAGGQGDLFDQVMAQLNGTD
ncbi:hypothetical protein JL2886_01023 [Phaeobacter gallaeciensis]|uniref:Phage terminase small subunit P27 family n=1 Tax=Phaeobacter gallaeciensis TaxID=60890 RepID=A0A1B0ZP68_9RHOB|nr:MULTISPECIES: P27 family phage terminase small subunit [Phaeobacter]ANP35945.1 hypothetical protein JL2886_01023 [Phaeobacter gallaeciensis]PVZ45151.1 phage terminase small subunit P27 family [Phaeobacter sp. JL2872]